MTSETMYNIVQFVRTLMPIFAAIGTVTSVIGFWKMFRKWGKPGVLSLLPFIRGWIFGKDSANTPRLIYAAADGMIVTLTPIFYYIRAYGDLQEYVVGGYTFYVDKAMLIVTAIWAVAEIARFFSSVHISANLCKKNRKGKGWTISWVLMPKLSKILWGFSNKLMIEEEQQ